MAKSKRNETSAQPNDQLQAAIAEESRKFQRYYLWLETHMPDAFFEEIDDENVMVVAHNLMAFHLQGYFSEIHLERKAICICIDSPDADLNVLKLFQTYGIKNYRAFVSSVPPPIPGVDGLLRVAVLHFTEAHERREPTIPENMRQELYQLMHQRNPEVNQEEFNKLLSGMNTRFLSALPPERLILAMEMFFRAKTRDHLQYEVRYNEDWKETEAPSVQIMMAWRNTPKHAFIYRVALMVHRHGLVMQKVNATYVDPHSRQPILVMGLGLHGIDGRPTWEVADMPDFLRELATLKYFGAFDNIDNTFVVSGYIRGNMGVFLRTIVNFIHQILVNLDPYLYSFENIKEGLCRHPELTKQLCEAFEAKFHPDQHNIEEYRRIRDDFYQKVDQLDTGREVNDIRRKNILRQGMNMVEHILRTNFYRNNKVGISMRLDPQYLDHIPYDRKVLFPELPFAVYFVKGMHYFGYHVRFKDLARGGLRTVYPTKNEQMVIERNSVFVECYNLAYTQHKKNKDIPEGGAKGVIFLKPYTRLESEISILSNELKKSNLNEESIESRIISYRNEQTIEYLYQTQRSFIDALLTIINCDESGALKAKHVVDYYKKPEYVYLGPDENMHNAIITWIAKHSIKFGYKPGGAFISSKPGAGINHKEFGVTSYGVNVYMEEVLKFLGKDPKKDCFKVKMTGGPDGDVAGNQISNLYKFYRNTAKLTALVDGSGTINDPEGLNLDILHQLFTLGKPVKFYPPDQLSEGGFLMDRTTRKDQEGYMPRTLCYRKVQGEVIEDWLTGSEMNRLFRNNVHQSKADVFIPAGGRPRTLNAVNWREFLDENGQPTADAIVEGANLYLTVEARQELEKLGVLIFKDSSANKGGVICSSFEVLCGLVLGERGFIENKPIIVNEILEILKNCALNEAQLLLRTHKETGISLTNLSDRVSEIVNKYTYEILSHLETINLPQDPEHPLIKAYLAYCPPTLRQEFRTQLLENVPEGHKKAIISCFLASQLVYHRGLDWSPSIADVLPVIWEDSDIVPQ